MVDFRAIIRKVGLSTEDFSLQQVGRDAWHCTCFEQVGGAEASQHTQRLNSSGAKYHLRDTHGISSGRVRRIMVAAESGRVMFNNAGEVRA